MEIEIPIQPPRVTLARARAMRDVLERDLQLANPDWRPEIIAIAMRFENADILFHSLHSGVHFASGGRFGQPIDPKFRYKKALAQLHELARFIATIEAKFSRRPKTNSSAPHSPDAALSRGLSVLNVG